MSCKTVMCNEDLSIIILFLILYMVKVGVLVYMHEQCSLVNVFLLFLLRESGCISFIHDHILGLSI